MMVLFAGVICVGGLLTVATLLGRGKCLFLIAGYLTTPKEKRERIDWPALGRFLSIILRIASLGLVLLFFCTWTDSRIIEHLGRIIFLGPIFFAVIYANTGGRFQK